MTTFVPFIYLHEKVLTSSKWSSVKPQLFMWSSHCTYNERFVWYFVSLAYKGKYHFSVQITALVHMPRARMCSTFTFESLGKRKYEVATACAAPFFMEESLWSLSGTLRWSEQSRTSWETRDNKYAAEWFLTVYKSAITQHGNQRFAVEKFKHIYFSSKCIWTWTLKHILQHSTDYICLYNMWMTKYL